MFQTIMDFIGTAANLKTVISVGGTGFAVLSNLGALPKVGCGRAIILHFQSKFRSASPYSVREKEIKFLRSKLESFDRGRYVVVTGGKGLGKTCLIDSVLNRYGGVVTISVRVSTCIFNNILIHFCI
jgi:hypothetical protein